MLKFIFVKGEQFIPYCPAGQFSFPLEKKGCRLMVDRYNFSFNKVFK